MLADRIQEWGEEFKREALSKGLQKGRQEGRQEGRQQGRQEGHREGRQEGRREGRQEGLQQGLQEGEARLLLRQLQKRFGEVPDWVRSRLNDAPLEQLESWGERLLDAASLEALFSEERSAAPRER